MSCPSAFGFPAPHDSLYFGFNWGPFAGFWSAYWGGRRLGGTVYSGGGVNTEMPLKQIVELRPTVLVSTPTHALAMAEKANPWLDEVCRIDPLSDARPVCEG